MAVCDGLKDLIRCTATLHVSRVMRRSWNQLQFAAPFRISYISYCRFQNVGHHGVGSL